MQIQVEEKQPLQMYVTYIGDSDKVLSKRDEVFQDILKESKKIKVPGFRPGKASVSAIKLRYKDVIEQNVQQRMLQEAEQDILFETKMKTMFQPQVIRTVLSDSWFECEVLFFKKPDVELKQYKDLQLSAFDEEKTRKDIMTKIAENSSMVEETVKYDLDNSDSLKQFQDRFKEQVDVQLENSRKNHTEQELYSKLLEANQVDLPDWLVSLEVKEMVKGEQVDSFDEETRKQILETSEKRTKLTLILDKIREVEPELQFSNDELFKMAQEMITTSGQDFHKVFAHINQKGQLSGLVAAVNQKATLDWLLNHNQIVNQ